MASHHAKDKGDLGLVMVIADMAAAGISVYLPLSEHQPADLVAMNEEGRVARVQVKYRKVSANGGIKLHFRSAYSDGKGYQEKAVDRSLFDCYAVYCPDNRKIYYIRNDEISSSTAIMLRVIPAKNGQNKCVIIASRFEGVDRIFEDGSPPWRNG